eukprot:TRINITY_DN17468_c0_g1_i1.p1 TRINITY_DN17468_c0_g1~~TRINITY_DN17468_c0_g1_i1.p1  ORF type:complete len:185 (+),score=5.06 TRINITY_DN17468_c0_g1_i1:83-637(+)
MSTSAQVASAHAAEAAPQSVDSSKIEYITYASEKEHIQGIIALIEKDLSEPYSIYTYRYFINNWPELCFMAMYEGRCIGVIVSKLDNHRGLYRGYIAMLAVDKAFRKQRIGSVLVSKSIEVMMKHNCEEVVLEAEITNTGALALYQNLGFVKDKRLYRYYMNGADAFRLKLFLPLLLENQQQRE